MRDNLELALARLYRYSEAEYKNHFRHVYRAYAIASSDNLDDLRRRLATGAFQPTHATKVYLPKRSGALRPYSLLSIEDQVVYQAMVNLVAERFDEAHKAKYYRSMFSNIPAGAKSQWFYRDLAEVLSEVHPCNRRCLRGGLSLRCQIRPHGMLRLDLPQGSVPLPAENRARQGFLLRAVRLPRSMDHDVVCKPDLPRARNTAGSHVFRSPGGDCACSLR